MSAGGNVDRRGFVVPKQVFKRERRCVRDNLYYRNMLSCKYSPSPLAMHVSVTKSSADPPKIIAPIK